MLARAAGATDAMLDNLASPAASSFDERTAAVLQFSEDVTLRSKEVPAEMYASLQRHFDEEQIVELTALIGLTNYFNRFNNALEVEPTQY